MWSSFNGSIGQHVELRYNISVVTPYFNTFNTDTWGAGLSRETFINGLKFDIKPKQDLENIYIRSYPSDTPTNGTKDVLLCFTPTVVRDYLLEVTCINDSTIKPAYIKILKNQFIASTPRFDTSKLSNGKSKLDDDNYTMTDIGIMPRMQVTDVRVPSDFEVYTDLNNSIVNINRD